MGLAVTAADRLVGALEAGAWPGDGSPGGDLLAALIDTMADPLGRESITTNLRVCRDNLRAGTGPSSGEARVRERAAWAYSVFCDLLERQPATATELAELIDEPRFAGSIPDSSRTLLDESRRQAFYWQGADCLEQGRLREAEQWFRLALDAGHLAARNELANVLDDLGQERAARALWTAAAAAGDADAAGNLGALYDRQGDMAQSEAWFRRATELGHVDASVRLGQRLYHRGHKADAEQLWREAAASGNGDACEYLGILLLERGDVEGAHHWLERAADDGHAGAARQLAALYDSIGRRDKAIEWLRVAAALGHPEAPGLLRAAASYHPQVAHEQELYDRLSAIRRTAPVYGRAANEVVTEVSREHNRQADIESARRRRWRRHRKG